MKVANLEKTCRRDHVLPEGACKQDEIDHYAEFCAALPQGSYLRSILSGTQNMIEGMIRNDFGWGIAEELHKLWREKAQAQKDVEDARKELEKVKAGIRDEEHKLAKLRVALDDCRNQARSILNAR